MLLLLACLLALTGCLHYQRLKKSGCSLGVEPVPVCPHCQFEVQNIMGYAGLLLTLDCDIETLRRSI